MAPAVAERRMPVRVFGRSMAGCFGGDGGQRAGGEWDDALFLGGGKFTNAEGVRLQIN